MTLERKSTSQSIRSHRSAGGTLSEAIALSRTKSAVEGSEAGDGKIYPDSSDPLLGHLHHLTKEQETALETFKSTLIEKQLYTPAAEGKEASHDDSTLLRFLRARRFDVKGALDQFQATEEWRATNQIDLLYENIEVDSYEESRRVYPQWTGRRDRRGIPVYVFVIRDLNSKNMAAYSSGTASKSIAATHASSKVPPRLLRLFALYQNMLNFVLPLCSSLDRPNPETPIVSTTNIVDISGVGLKQFWNLKGHMQDASVLATANYPETLDRIFIIGAPAFFPTVWGWIKRWFDPVTTSKIFILSSSEVKSTLTNFMDPSSFPKQYGGELDWDWGDMPILDEPARAIAGALERIGEYGDKDDTPTTATATTAEEKDGDKPQKPEFLKGPIAFKGDRMEIYGSVNGEPRRRTVPVPQRPVVKDTVPPSGRKSEDDSGVDMAAAPNAEDEKAAQTSRDTEADRTAASPPQAVSA